MQNHLDNDFVEEAARYALSAHSDQRRKYTGEPYFNHVSSVAWIVKRHGGDPAMIAAAYLHDVLEDTDVTEEEIRTLFGNDITDLVHELTDVYTKEAYTEMNRSVRKMLESERLGKISDRAQSIKFADFIDNGKDISIRDAVFARTYFREMSLAVHLMKKGNPDLRNEVINMILDFYIDSRFLPR